MHDAALAAGKLTRVRNGGQPTHRKSLCLEGSKPYCHGEAKGEGNMSTPVSELFRQASELNEHDRATLAGLLLESLEREVDENVESAWQEEIERRLAELDADSVKLVPRDEVKAKLMRRTGAERQD
jgi:putative addiction module component (TIGR02574 family)